VNGRLCGVVLAAGASKRLGQPKQLLVHRGEPLVRAIANVLLASPSIAKVGVVVGSAHEAVGAAVSELAIELVQNDAWEEGMASSVRAAVRWANCCDAEGLVVTLVDQVRLSALHLEALALAAAGRRAAASGYGGTIGVPAIFDASTFDALLALEGDRGAARVLRSLDDVAVVPWEDGLVDIDTTDDLVSCLGSRADR
jgi:CTP:molybdopterin cytidylyltransferase MocA